MPTLRLPMPRTRLTVRSMSRRLLGSMLSSSGRSMFSWREMWFSARRSFGRQEPPNAKPGIRYFFEMLSLSSMHSTRMTSWLSMSRVLQMAPISLAKVTFSAWKALFAYLIISAAFSAILTTGASTKSYRAATTSPLRSSSSPITVTEGWTKSSMEQPSRRNSGFIAKPSRPASTSAATCGLASISDAVVPGGTVLRMMMTW